MYFYLFDLICRYRYKDGWRVHIWDVCKCRSMIHYDHTGLHRQQCMAWWMLVSLPSCTSSIVKIYLKSQHQKSPYKPFRIAILPPRGNLPNLYEKNSVQNQIARLWKAFKMPSATWASWWESAGWWNFHGKCCDAIPPVLCFMFRQRCTSRHKCIYISVSQSWKLQCPSKKA